jgi:hypothetical protein
VKLEKAPGYWPTRIMLAVAVTVVGIELLLAPAFLWPGYMEPMFDPRVALFGIPPGVAMYAASVGMSLAGLARMFRVYRGPRDEPSPWRFRDR